MAHMMQSSIFTAAVRGDTRVLKEDVIAEQGEDNYLLKTNLGNNIVHVAAQQRCRSTFVKKALARFPDLLRQKNKEGNTPLHVAAELGTKETLSVILSYLRIRNNETISSGTCGGGDTEVSYLFERNNEGDTPFHVSLRSQNLAVAEELFKYIKDHPQVLVAKNESLETPLHLYVRYCSGGIFPEILKHDGYHNIIVDKPKLIDQLIEANPSALFENDMEGMNPLMKAAQYGRVLIVHRILTNHTMSIECRDQNRRSFLHLLRLRMSDLNAKDKESTLWVCEKILQVPGVATLLYSPDQDGNTPLHLAVLNRDFDFAHIILRLHYLENNRENNCFLDSGSEDSDSEDSDSEDSDYGESDLEDPVEVQKSARKELIMSVNNNEGKTVFDLITFGSDIPIHLKELMGRAIMGTLMNEEQLLAAQDAHDNILSSETNFLSQAADGSSIIHIALKYENENSRNTPSFIKSALEKYPNMIYVKDCNGDTPLHIAARLQSKAALMLLETSLSYWRDNNNMQTLCVPPWRVKNLRGNTPFHEAACTSNYKSLSVLYRFCKIHVARSEAMSEVNNDGETVLHILARYGRNPDDLSEEETCDYDILAKSRVAAHMRDVDGLTPILRAAHCGQAWVVGAIRDEYLTSMEIRDYRGRGVLHHLCTSVVNDALVHRFEETKLWNKFYPEVQNNLVFSQDHDGNTPLHLAIMHQNFKIARFIIKQYAKSTLREKLMGMKNNVGKSVRDLIQHGSDIPLILKRQTKLMDQAHTLATTMDDKTYDAITKKDMNVFELNLRFSGETPDGSNIIHIAVRHFNYFFLERVLEEYYSLLYRKDSKGDSPLHLAAGLENSQALKFFKLCLDAWQSDSYLNNASPQRPWTVVNSKGNTFLHEAARACNYQVISYIWAGNYKVRDAEQKFDIENVIDHVNDHGETILHVIARYATCEAKGILEEYSDQMKPLVYVADFEGFTPVLRAVQCGRLGVARLLVQQYPQSIVMSDTNGWTVLHHLKALCVDLVVDDLKDIIPVWKDFFKYPGVDDLRIAQNKDGNTPLHLAIIDADFTKARFLMEICLESENKRELIIANNDGHLVYDLLLARSHMTATKELQQLMSRSFVKERELVSKVMDDELYLAATKGSVQVFQKALGDDVETGLTKLDEDYFCRQTPGGSNILHIALGHGNLEAEGFLKKALECFPILSMRSDSNGDTPLHLAAKWKSGVKLVQSLILASKAFLDNLDERNKAFHVAPWTVKNYKGSFPIHEALQTDYLKAAEALLDCDDEAASRVNDLGETPLHAFASNGFSVSDDDADKFVKALIEKNSKAAYTRDKEGLTPLLSAARSGQFQVVRAILKYRPQSSYLRDPKGRTFLHLLRFTGEDIDESFAGTFKNTGKQLFKIPEADAQRLVQDYEGDTPLHYAIKTENSIAAIVLTQRCLESENRAELGLTNKEGRTIPDLLALHDAPNEIIELIRKRVPEAVYLARSSYGIRKTEMKESANALSVVAALLATITFAAGLQVPGGFNEDDGSPILLTKPAFTVFVVANSGAMCCAMLCLFLLLWVMGIGKIHGSLMLLDVSIMLIRLSFHLTLLTFTMGVFVVTANKSLWLAIFVCVLCFLTFLLTWRYSIKLLAKYAGGAVEKNKKNNAT